MTPIEPKVGPKFVLSLWADPGATTAKVVVKNETGAVFFDTNIPLHRTPTSPRASTATGAPAGATEAHFKADIREAGKALGKTLRRNKKYIVEVTLVDRAGSPLGAAVNADTTDVDPKPMNKHLKRGLIAAASVLGLAIVILVVNAIDFSRFSLPSFGGVRGDTRAESARVAALERELAETRDKLAATGGGGEVIVNGKPAPLTRGTLPLSSLVVSSNSGSQVVVNYGTMGDIYNGANRSGRDGVTKSQKATTVETPKPAKWPEGSQPSVFCDIPLGPCADDIRVRIIETEVKIPGSSSDCAYRYPVGWIVEVVDEIPRGKLEFAFNMGTEADQSWVPTTQFLGRTGYPNPSSLWPRNESSGPVTIKFRLTRARY